MNEQEKKQLEEMLRNDKVFMLALKRARFDDDEVDFEVTSRGGWWTSSKCCGEYKIRIKEYFVKISPEGIKTKIPRFYTSWYCLKCGRLGNNAIENMWRD